MWIGVQCSPSQLLWETRPARIPRLQEYMPDWASLVARCNCCSRLHCGSVVHVKMNLYCSIVTKSLDFRQYRDASRCLPRPAHRPAMTSQFGSHRTWASRTCWWGERSNLRIRNPKTSSRWTPFSSWAVPQFGRSRNTDSPSRIHICGCLLWNLKLVQRARQTRFKTRRLRDPRVSAAAAGGDGHITIHRVAFWNYIGLFEF